MDPMVITELASLNGRLLEVAVVSGFIGFATLSCLVWVASVGSTAKQLKERCSQIETDLRALRGAEERLRQMDITIAELRGRLSSPGAGRPGAP